MPSYFNWFRAVGSSAPVIVYRMATGFPRQQSPSASTPQLAEGLGQTHGAALVARRADSLDWSELVPLKSPFDLNPTPSIANKVQAIHPRSAAFDLFVNGQQVYWFSNAPSSASTRVACAYTSAMRRTSISMPTIPLGPFSVNHVLDRNGVIVCGDIIGDDLDPPFLFAGSGVMRSAMNDYSGQRFIASHSFESTVPPFSAILELTVFDDSGSRSALASAIIFAANGLGRNKVAVVCDDSGTNHALSVTGVEQYGNAFVHPVCLSAAITEIQASRNDCAFAMGFFNPHMTAGVANTSAACLRPRAALRDWGSTRSMPFVGRADMTFEEKHKSFENPTNQRLFYPQANGIGSPNSPLPQNEISQGFAEKSFTEADGTPSALLSSSDVSWLELDVYAETNSATAITPQGAEMPIVFQNNQSAFRIGGQVVQGTTVRFEPWSSNEFIGPIESAGRNVVAIGNPLTTELFPDVLDYFVTGLVEQSLDGIRWNATGATLSLIDRTDLGVIAPSETRLYDSSTYNGFNRSTTFGGTYSPNAQWDESGYLAGLACSAMAQGGHIATTSEQQPPLASNISGFLDSEVNVRYPVRTALTGASGYKPSLAGQDFSCVAANVEGVPYTAGTFQYRGPGGQATVQLSQQMQGPIDVVEFEKPLPASFPEDKSLIRLPFNAGQTFYEASATHGVTMTTTFVDIMVKWFVSLQGPGVFDSSFSPTDINGADVDDLRGAVGLEHFVRTSAASGVRPCLMAKVWARALGKVGIESDYEFPEILAMSGSFPAFARAWDAAEGQNAFPNPGDGSPGSIYGAVYPMDEVTAFGGVATDNLGFLVPGNAFRRDGSYATWENNSYVDMGSFYFDGDQTAQLLAGSSVTATRWINDQPNLPQVAAWHNSTFGTYKLTFRLDFA